MLKGKIWQFQQVLDEEDFSKIYNFGKKLNFVENPSFVYNTVEKVDEVVPDVRQSRTVMVRDRALLGFVEDRILRKLEELIAGGGEVEDLVKMRLARDYLTFIEYQEGGFFDWHRDFEKVSINGGQSGFMEMHFLFCLEGCESGGELKIRTGGAEGEVAVVDEVRVANSAVVFDKKMEHRAEEVGKGGIKLIMTVDVNVNLEITEFLNLEVDSKDIVEKVRDLVAGKLDYWTSLKAGEVESVYQFIKMNYPKEVVDRMIPFVEVSCGGYEEGSFRVLVSGNQVIYFHYDIEKYDEPIVDVKCFRGKIYVRYGKHRSGSGSGGWYDKSLEEKYWVAYDGKEWTEFDYEIMGEYSEEAINVVKDIVDDIDGGYEPIRTIFEKGYKVFQDSYENNLQDSFGKFERLDVFRRTVSGLLGEIPKSLEEDRNWARDKVGYTYHCNEPSYGQYEVEYRYGILVWKPELAVPRDVEAYPKGMFDWENFKMSGINLPSPIMEQIENVLTRD